MKKETKKQIKPEVPVKYKYWKTLGESIKLVFQKPKILVPFAAGWILGLLLVPFMTEVQDPVYFLDNLAMIITVYLIFMFVGFIIYGWNLSVINQILIQKTINLGKALKRAFSFGLRALAVYVLAFLVVAAAYAVVAIVISAIGNFGIWGTIVALVIGTLFVVFFFLYMTAIMQLTPILVIEDKGIIETIKMTKRFYFSKKLYSLNIFLLSFILMMILSIPVMLYQMSLALQTIGQPVMYSTEQMLISNIISLIPNIFFIMITVYYCRSYMIKREKLK